jgi:hypothetical protein
MVTIAVILLCVNVVLWVVLYLRLNRQFNAATLLESLREQVRSITTEINKNTDNLLTLADSRKTELRELLAQVERQITLVNESLDRAEQVQGGGYLFPVPLESSLSSGSAAVSSKLSSALPSASPTPPDPSPIILPPVAESAVSLRQRARALAASGLSADAIADTLGLSVTEVELFTL